MTKFLWYPASLVNISFTTQLCSWLNRRRGVVLRGRTCCLRLCPPLAHQLPICPPPPGDHPIPSNTPAQSQPTQRPKSQVTQRSWWCFQWNPCDAGGLDRQVRQCSVEESSESACWRVSEGGRGARSANWGASNCKVQQLPHRRRVPAALLPQSLLAAERGVMQNYQLLLLLASQVT